MPRYPTRMGGYRPIKTGHPKVPYKVQRTKNVGGAEGNRALALSAIRQGVCIHLLYDGCERVAEVHTVGVTTAGRPAMSVYQVDGQSNTPPIPDWRLFCFDECFDVRLTNIPSAAPRPEYKKGAKQFKRIDAEI